MINPIDFGQEFKEEFTVDIIAGMCADPTVMDFEAHVRDLAKEIDQIKDNINELVSPPHYLQLKLERLGWLKKYFNNQTRIFILINIEDVETHLDAVKNYIECVVCTLTHNRGLDADPKLLSAARRRLFRGLILWADLKQWRSS